MTEPYTPASTPHPEGPFPQTFGRYRLEACLGRGAHGAVYRAFDLRLRTPVALKIPTPRVQDDPALLERFYREARAAARLRQQAHLCQILDVGVEGGQPYLTMQLIEGKPLATGTLWDQREAVRLVWKLARALSGAHAAGVVHRDLKPDNVLLDANGEPTLTDFGVALLLDADERRLTQSGTCVGSWCYMAPEQLGEPDRMGPACDVYGLGVVLYELLLGRPPFLSSNVHDLIRMINEWPPPVPRQLRPDLDGRLEAICLEALAKQPGDRFTDMRAFANALAGYLGEEPMPQPATSGEPTARPLLPREAIRFIFCGVGEVAPPRLRAGYLYLDVGNGLRTGVIDHHHLSVADTCTACLVPRYASCIDAARPAHFRPEDRFTIVLHEEPDMDAVASAYLVRHYLTQGNFPAGTEDLVDYVARIDEGSLGLTLAQPFALYAAYKQLLSRFLLRQSNSKTELWQQIVHAGLELIEFVLDRTTREEIPLEQVDAFRCPGWFTQEDRGEITLDLDRYQRKLNDPTCHARQVTLSLPGQGEERIGVPVLLVRDVQNTYDPDHCRFFRDWARSDVERSGVAPGFIGLSVFHSEGRGQVRKCIISVTPDSGASLRGLGRLLDEAEAAKRIGVYGVDDRAEDPITGMTKPPRPGYSNADPWYDGRGHHDTIVDAPRSGTLLTADEIEQVLLVYGRCGTPPRRLAG